MDGCGNKIGPYDCCTIVTGDAKELATAIPDESVDLVVTDPPYAWSFMGKEWDKALPSVDIWKECLRVLKPGAFAFVMSGPRMDCLSEMGRRLAEAGFETGFSPIFWSFASGFPKAMSMSKAIDRRLGAEREVMGRSANTRDRTSHSTTTVVTSQDVTGWDDKSIPATPEAQALDGSYAGFQPKPAVEVVIVAMKPLAHGTYIDQALDNGHGITWLDDGRIPYQSDGDKRSPYRADGTQGGANAFHGDNEWGDSRDYMQSPGRFPANLLVSDDVLNDGRVQKSGTAINRNRTAEYIPRNVYGAMKMPHNDDGYPDSGSFSRYFSLDAWAESVQRTFPFLICPKAAKKEKNLGCEGLEAGVGPARYGQRGKCVECGRWQESGEAACVCGGRYERHSNQSKQENRNRHPCVKPLKLMSYLVTLASRPGDLILDPFAGTCTTGMAAKMLGRDYLMIEMEEQWCQIGQRRIDAIQERLL